MSTFGRLSSFQRGVLAPFVRDRVVHDLGAGDLALARDLARKARVVVAVDHVGFASGRQGNIITLSKRFEDFLRTHQAETAFVSWPSTATFGAWSVDGSAALVDVCARATTVAYLGKNTDGTACGTPALFELLSRRELVAYVPERYNTLCVYRGVCRARVDLRGEERAGLLSRTRTFTFEEAEGGGEGRTFERDAPF